MINVWLFLPAECGISAVVNTSLYHIPLAVSELNRKSIGSNSVSDGDGHDSGSGGITHCDVVLTVLKAVHSVMISHDVYYEPSGGGGGGGGGEKEDFIAATQTRFDWRNDSSIGRELFTRYRHRRFQIYWYVKTYARANTHVTD